MRAHSADAVGSIPSSGLSADDANLLARWTLSASDLSEGMTFEIVYPFLRDTYHAYDGEGGYDVKTWKPGVEWEGGLYRDSAGCDAEGLCRFTVVSVHKPGRYPTRVFYTRQFTNPDGKPFGKGRLHMVSVEKFRRLIRGYRDDYDVGEPEASYQATTASSVGTDGPQSGPVVKPSIDTQPGETT